MPGVRLAIGSNAASRWWLNGEPVIALNDDRQSVIDDGVSRRLTLRKGRNVIRAAIINGGGATDFCARFLDENDKPIHGLNYLAIENPGHEKPTASFPRAAPGLRHPGPGRAPTNTPSSLVHGATAGGWEWKSTGKFLTDDGHTVYRATLTGLGERMHLNGPTSICRPTSTMW